MDQKRKKSSLGTLLTDQQKDLCALLPESSTKKAFLLRKSVSPQRRESVPVLENGFVRNSNVDLRRAESLSSIDPVVQKLRDGHLELLPVMRKKNSTQLPPLSGSKGDQRSSFVPHVPIVADGAPRSGRRESVRFQRVAVTKMMEVHDEVFSFVDELVAAAVASPDSTLSFLVHSLVPTVTMDELDAVIPVHAKGAMVDVETSRCAPGNSIQPGTSGSHAAVGAPIAAFIDVVMASSAKDPTKPLIPVLRSLGNHRLSNSMLGQSSAESTSVSEGSGSDLGEFIASTKSSVLSPMVPSMAMRCFPADSTTIADATSWSGYGSVLFIDISGYSKITSALADHGAHELSDTVNSYLERILRIVRSFGGDVVKFAGDAIIVIWHFGGASNASPSRNPHRKRDLPGEAGLPLACAMATGCALELQNSCGEHAVPLAGSSFFLHIGVSCGVVESEVLVPARQSDSSFMQRGYHFVTGRPIVDASDAVDTAKAQQVCITESALSHLRTRVPDVVATCAPTTVSDQLHIVTAIGVFDLEQPVYAKPHRAIEAAFVFPYTTERLVYGFRPMHMPEMRNLAVLFIRMNDGQAIGIPDWFAELYQELDRWRCSIVQAIDDDKGFHVVAAVGLFESEASPATVAVNAARSIVGRHLACTIGIATGPVFCGFIGSEAVAMRWDITGEAVVRACRLMQAATTLGIAVAMDNSLKESAQDVNQFAKAGTVNVKGSADPVPVFTLTEYGNPVTHRIVTGASVQLDDNVHGSTISDFVSFFRSSFDSGCRPLGVCTGPLSSGKFSVSVQVLEKLDCAVVYHKTNRDSRQLALCETIGQFFSYSPILPVKKLGEDIREAYERHHLVHAMELTCQLIAELEKRRVRVGLLVLHAQFLDRMSINLLAELHRVKPLKSYFGTMLTHYPLFGVHTTDALLARLNHHVASTTELNRDSMGSIHGGDDQFIVREIGTASIDEVGLAVRAVPRPQDMSYLSSAVMHNLADGLIDLVASIGSFVSKEWFRLRAEAERTGEPMKELTRMDVRGVAHFMQAGLDALADARWTAVAPTALKRISLAYDVLPPRLQVILKIVAGMSAQGHTECPTAIVTKLVEKMVSRRNAKLVDKDIDILVSLKVLNASNLDRRQQQSSVPTVWFLNPALRDFIIATLTPKQLRSINSMCANSMDATYEDTEIPDGCPKAALLVTLAGFHRVKGPTGSDYDELLEDAWQHVQMVDEDEPERLELEDKIAKELRLSGRSAEGTLHSDVAPRRKFVVKDGSVPAIGPNPIIDCKNFKGPMRMGPLSGLLGLIGEVLKLRYYETTRSETLVTEEVELLLRRGIEQYADALLSLDELLKRHVGSHCCAIGGSEDVDLCSVAAEESALLARVSSRAETDEEALRHAEEFLAFGRGAFEERAIRFEEVVPAFISGTLSSLADTITSLEGEANDTRVALHKAVAALTLPGAIVADSEQSASIVATPAFHSTLLVLANLKFRSAWVPKVSLVQLRDECLAKGSSAFNDFASFLCVSLTSPMDP